MLVNFIFLSHKAPRVYKITHLTPPTPPTAESSWVVHGCVSQLHRGLRAHLSLGCEWQAHKDQCEIDGERYNNTRAPGAHWLARFPCSSAIPAECSETDGGYSTIECINRSRQSVFPTHVRLSVSSPSSSISIYNPSSKNNALIYVSQMDGVVPGRSAGSRKV